MIKKDIIFIAILVINFIIGGFLYATNSSDGMVMIVRFLSLILPMIILIISKNISNKFNDWIES